MTQEVLIAVISVLGGSFLTALASLWKARQEARKIRHDISSVTVASAEHALLMLKTALEEAEKDLVNLRRERDEERERHKIESLEKDRRISELEQNLRHISALFEDVSERLTQVLQAAKEATEDSPNA